MVSRSRAAIRVAVSRAAGDLGKKVPADLSLDGYDDIHIAKYQVPRLTTVSKDSVRVGREAVRQLLARIAKPDLPYQKVSIPPRLIVSESTGPAPVSAG